MDTNDEEILGNWGCLSTNWELIHIPLRWLQRWAVATFSWVCAFGYESQRAVLFLWHFRALPLCSVFYQINHIVKRKGGQEAMGAGWARDVNFKAKLERARKGSELKQEVMQ